MLIGFFGSRYCHDAETIKSVLKALHSKIPIQVVTGDCIGLDECCYWTCKELNIPVGVFVVSGNPLGYQPDNQDIIHIISKGPLKRRLHNRTVAMVRHVAQHKGILIGYQVTGKGSQLCIKTAKSLNVPVYVVDPESRKIRKIFPPPSP